jgi:hypothetical protein
MHAVAGAGLRYFAIVFAAGFVLGTVRTLLVVPRWGELPAVLAELPLMLAISWWASGAVLRRVPLTPPAALAAGALAFALLLVAEAAISVALAGRSLGEHLALYALPAHQAGLAAQAAFALMPWLRASRGRRVR